MLYLKDAIRIEKYRPPGGNGGPKNQYIFKCKNCTNEIKIKALSRLKTATGLCVTCNNRMMHPRALEARRIRPYENCFNTLTRAAQIRNIKVEIIYEQFLNFVKVQHCHYCNYLIKWKKYGNSGYNLDRKNNNGSYSLDNLVVCCFKCNKGKREIYTYEEWYGMTEYFRRRL
jgi:hypothetical protein